MSIGEDRDSACRGSSPGVHFPLLDHPRRVAGNDRAGGDVPCHHSAGADDGVVGDGDVGSDEGFGGDPDAVADADRRGGAGGGGGGGGGGGVGAGVVGGAGAEDGPLADDGVVADRDGAEVVAVDAGAQVRPVADLQQPGV